MSKIEVNMKNINRNFYAVIGVIILLLTGFVYAWSVIGKSIGASYTNWTKAELSMTFTIVMIFFCIGGLIAGMLSKKIKPRVYVIISAGLFLIGFLIASVATKTIILYFGFGVLCGLASGLAYNAVMSTVSLWFTDKQGLISGVLLMGFGISSFIFGKVFAEIAPADGGDTWRIVFKVFAVAFFVILIVCSIFVVRPENDCYTKKISPQKSIREPAMEAPPEKVVKNVSFWMYYVWSFLMGAAGLALVSQASGIAGQIGSNVSDSSIVTVVGLISIFNGVGRVFFGYLFDRKGYKATILIDIVIFVVTGLILMVALLTGQFILIIIGFVSGGLAYGGVTPTNSAIINDFFGRKYFSINFSLVNTNLIIASFASTIAGKLYDSSQSYFSTIILMIVLTVLGFFVFVGIKRPEIN